MAGGGAGVAASAGAGGLAQLARAALVAGGLGLAGTGAIAGVYAMAPDTQVPLIGPVAPMTDIVAAPLSFAPMLPNTTLPASPGLGGGPGVGGGPLGINTPDTGLPRAGTPVPDVPADVTNVPEPASITVFASGSLAALLLRARRRRAGSLASGTAHG